MPGEALLHLWTLGEQIDHPCELGQADHLARFPRNVADVRLAEKRHQMMLAGGIDRYILHHHEFPVILAKSAIQHGGGVRVQTGENLGIGTCHPSRGFPQPLAVGILADGQEKLPDGTLRPLMIHPL